MFLPFCRCWYQPFCKSDFCLFLFLLQVLVLASFASLGYSATCGSHSWSAFGRDQSWSSSHLMSMSLFFLRWSYWLLGSPSPFLLIFPERPLRPKLQGKFLMSCADQDDRQECESKKLDFFKKYSWICFSADLHLCNVLIVETDRVAHMTTIQVFTFIWPGMLCPPCHHKIKSVLLLLIHLLILCSRRVGQNQLHTIMPTKRSALPFW